MGWYGHVERIKPERMLKNEFHLSPQEEEGGQGVCGVIKHTYRLW
jgi:hypothetical protein